MVRAVALIVAALVAIVQGQDNHVALCGPFNNWAPCPSQNNVPQCCSKWGFCSEPDNHEAFCAQQALGNFYKNSIATGCNSDNDCADPTNPAAWKCSKEPTTFGACMITYVDAFNGTNPFGLGVLPTTAAQAANVVSTTNGPTATTAAAADAASKTSSGSIPTVHISLVTIFAIASAVVIMFAH